MALQSLLGGAGPFWETTSSQRSETGTGFYSWCRFGNAGGMRGGVGSILRAKSSARERKMRNAACPCGAALLPAPAPARGTPPLSWGGFEQGPHGARAKARQPSTTLFCVAPSIQNDTPSTVQSGTARGVKISGGMEGGGAERQAGTGTRPAAAAPPVVPRIVGVGMSAGLRAAGLGGAGRPRLVRSSVADASRRCRGRGGPSVRSRGPPLPNLRGATRGAAAEAGVRLRPRARAGGP